jgi:hypothetical protein
LELEERLRWALEARGPVAAAWDPERLRAEPAIELLRAGDLELLRTAEFELLRTAEFELLRVEPELELRRIELAAVAPLSLAAGRLRLPAFGEALCFGLVCLATSPHSTAGTKEEHLDATSIAAG